MILHKASILNGAILICIFLLGTSCHEVSESGDRQISFFDDFEKGLINWDINNPEKIRIIKSGDPKHNNVLEMHPGGSNTFVLMKQSNSSTTRVKVEGDVLFPENDHCYLGFIYNYNVQDVRVDYGCIYIKGNGSYVRVNPHRDANVSRILYDEFRANLTGKDSIIINQWQHFKAEVSDSICHFYVGDMITPKVTFNFHEFSSGRIGFEPRVTGSEVWIDNISIEEIEELSFKGVRQPEEINYEPEQLLTSWKVIGPFRHPHKQIEEDGVLEDVEYKSHNNIYTWAPFKTDARGCVVGGKIIEWASLKTHAYFATEIEVTETTKAALHFSTTNDLKIWHNQAVIAELEGQGRAWYDFYKNPKHQGQLVNITLQPGKNSILIREKGPGFRGYAGDGFYAKLEK